MIKTALLITLLIVSGCGMSKAYRMYTGDTLPKDQVAILEDSTHFYGISYCTTNFWSMDGVDVRDKETLELLPGPHHVAYTVNYNDGFSAASRSGAFKFHAEAGHMYQLDLTNCISTPRFETWIEDTTTGTVVAGTKP